MANWTLPSLTSLYTDFLSVLKGRDEDLARQFSPTYTSPSNLITGTIRWNPTNSYWELWNGSTWSALDGEYAINVTQLGGQSAAHYLAWANITGKPASYASADKLTTPRSISLTGGATGSVNFDGSANVSMTVTLSGDYLLLTGGTLTGALTVNGALSVPNAGGQNILLGTNGIITTATVVSIGGTFSARSDANPNYEFRNASGVIHALMYLNRGLASVDRPGLLTFNLYDPNGSDARVIATIPDSIAKGGTLGGAQYLLTREHGDVRYPLKAATVQNNQLVYTGNVDTLFGPNASASYFCTTLATNGPVAGINFTLLVQTHPTNGNFASQIAIESTSDTPRMWRRGRGSGVWSPWTLMSASTLVPEIATTSGTAFDFLNIPSGVNQIVVMFDGLSLSGTDEFLIQLGDSGGVETAGYESVSGLGGASAAASAAGFMFLGLNAAEFISGMMIMQRMSGNKWVSMHELHRGGSLSSIQGSGIKTLSGTLDRVRLTRSGSNTFDGGSVSIMYS